MNFIPTAPGSLPLGVHFGLSEEIYHADPGVGSSDLKRLLQSPPDYWWGSRMNDLREDLDTPSTEWGTAFHTLILLGREEFERRYVTPPRRENFPGLLDTVDDLKAYCNLHKLRATGTKSELLDRVRRHDPKVPLWADIVERHNASLEVEGRRPISQKVWDTVRLSEAMIVKNPHLLEAFTGGVPEVSVFWEQEGVRCKARIDYLKVRAIVDLKSFRNSRKMPLDRAIRMAISSNRYDIQAAHYMHARLAMNEYILEGKVYGDHKPREEWLLQVASNDNPEWVWVFYQADGAPVAKGFSIGMEGDIYEIPAREIRYALQRFRENLDKYGREIWVCDDPIERLHADDLPAWTWT